MKKLPWFLLFLAVMPACEKACDLYSDGPVELACADCVSCDPQDLSLCFDSVLTDSRCPEDMLCLWAGEAIARFSLTIRGEKHLLDLRLGDPGTLVQGYRLSFVDLQPYPKSNLPIEQEEYLARVVMERE